jgi:Cache domain
MTAPQPAGLAAHGEQGARGEQQVRGGRYHDLLAGITRRVEGVLGSVAELAAETAAIAAAAQEAARPLRRADLAALRRRVAAVLRQHAGLVAGAGVVLAPAALADAPRCIEWWWADQGSGPEQLQVDLDPESAEFYDYTATQWYREPESTGRPSVAGPYVDYICTHQYTITLSVPIATSGRFVGVAGADILAGQVERLVLPGLGRLDRPAILVSGDGRVIASSTAAIPPGTAAFRHPWYPELIAVAGPAATQLPGAQPAAAQLPAAGPASVLPWTLLVHPG